MANDNHYCTTPKFRQRCNDFTAKKYIEIILGSLGDLHGSVKEQGYFVKVSKSEGDLWPISL